jgi:hypothetical protein
MDPRAKPVSEVELRHLVLEHLRPVVVAEGDRVFEELPVERGAARVDVALIGRRLEAFELKSDADSFARLHNQIHAYNRVFDRITLVTGPSYTVAALQLMPSWWGIKRAERSRDGTLTLVDVREASDNTHQESHSLAMFLWRDEAISILAIEAAVTASKRSTRSQLHAALVEHLTLQTLRRLVIERLSARGAVRHVTPSARDDDWSHHDASCSDFRCLT